MSETLPIFRFDGYTLRPATAEDLPMAQRWIDADEEHHGTPPDFWTLEMMGVNCFVFEDAEGPLFFLRIQLTSVLREMRMYTQFAPYSAVNRTRLSRGLLDGMRWFEKYLAEMGYTLLTSTSRNPSLIQFCRRRLGFTIHGDTIRKVLGGNHEQGNEESQTEGQSA